MNGEAYDFYLEKTAEGKAKFWAEVNKELIRDELHLDATIKVEPTRESYEFMKDACEAIKAYAQANYRHGGLMISALEFAEFAYDSLSLESWLKTMLIDIFSTCSVDIRDYRYQDSLNRLFVIDKMWLVIGKDGDVDCNEVYIEDSSHYPIVHVTQMMRHYSFARWMDFDFLNVHLPLLNRLGEVPADSLNPTS